MPSRCRPLLGTFVEVKADHLEAIEAAFDTVEQVHRLMNAHLPDSDVSRINRFGHLRPIEVHHWTARVIERALFWSKNSGGAFDIVRAGKAAVSCGLLPSHADQPRPDAGHWTCLEMDGVAVRLLEAGCIDLGGIAKGFAVDRAIDALRESGCERGVINAGGDLAAFGREPSRFRVVHPITRCQLVEINVDDEALATSAGLPIGDGRLAFDHLGRDNGPWLSVSVLAAKACDADALTKIAWAGKAEINTLLIEAGARALAIDVNGEVKPFGELGEVAA